MSLTRKIPETLPLIVSGSLPWGPAHIRFVCGGSSEILSILYIYALYSAESDGPDGDLNCTISRLVHNTKHTSEHTSVFLFQIQMCISQTFDLKSMKACPLIVKSFSKLHSNVCVKNHIQMALARLRPCHLPFKLNCIHVLLCGHISSFNQQMHLQVLHAHYPTVHLNLTLRPIGAT